MLFCIVTLGARRSMINNLVDCNMQRKKLLYIVEAMGGGVFTYLVDLANGLCDEFDIYILFAVREQTPTNYRQYFEPQIKMIKAKHLVREINPKEDLLAIKEIRREIKRIKPDVVHLHSSKAGVLGRIAINGRKIPMFYTPHGYSFLMKDQKKSKRIAYWIIEKICAMYNCTTVACGEGEGKEALLLSPKSIYIENGINIRELQANLEKMDDIAEKQYDVFTIGRICYQKNPKLFNEIASRFPDMSFLWIGDGDMRQELTAPNITVTGWLNRSDVLRIAKKTKIFMLTSLWEGLPISLLEAMYLKKICIVSDVIGNRDVIKNKVNGYVCANVHDYMIAIKECHKEGNEHVMQAAYDEICEKYNTDVMIKKYENLYKEATYKEK